MKRFLITTGFLAISTVAYADYCKMTPSSFTFEDGDNKVVEYLMTVSNKRVGDKLNCLANFDTNSMMMNIEISKPSKLNETKIIANTTIRYFPKKVGEDSLTVKRTWQGSVGKPMTATITYKIKVVDHDL